MLKKAIVLVLSIWSMLPSFAQGDTKLEAEDASHVNCTVIRDNKYSGGKAIEMTEDNAKISFRYNATKRGKYTIHVGYDALYGSKVFNVSVNGSAFSFQTGNMVREEAVVGAFIMNQGTNTIVITPSWTWFRIDYIRVEQGGESLEFDIVETPVDANATNAAKALYTFLHENFGKKTISCIMTGDMTTADGNVTHHADVQAVYKASGKYPALVGFDFMNATGMNANSSWNRSYTTASIQLAEDTYRRGGIPAFTWHWRDPSHRTDAFYTSDSNMKITDAMNADGSWNTSSTLYRNIIKDIDIVADYFLAMQDKGIACVFRPLHEASGGWFWWGREGAKPFVKLYHLLFDEMVNVKGVHNVIWIWNAGENDAEWNPGFTYFDVVSADIYNNDFDYSSNYVLFDKLKMLTGGKKIIALSENGPIPDIDKEFDEEAVWSWWMPWYQTWNGNFVDKTSSAEWTKCMNDSRVITLEDLSAGWEAYAVIETPSTTNVTRQDIYDLQGRRLLNPPSKGMYIKGGKKYIKY